MKEATKELILLTSKRVLFELYCLTENIADGFGDRRDKSHVKNWINLEIWKSQKRAEFNKRMQYLHRKGYIEKLREESGNLEHLLLTDKGKRKAPSVPSTGSG